MGNLRDTLGFDRSKLWWYRDLTLSAIAGIALLWIIVLGFNHPSVFDLCIEAICVFVIAVCCIATPNRVLIVSIAVGIVVIQSWFAVINGAGMQAMLIAA